MLLTHSSLNVSSRAENILLRGSIDPVIHDYPAMNAQQPEIQLPIFKCNCMYCSCEEATDILKGLPLEQQVLFTETETLVGLLLVVPVSSSEAERNFSALG